MSGARKLIGERFACMPHVIASIMCIPLMKKDMLQGMLAWLQGIISFMVYFVSRDIHMCMYML